MSETTGSGLLARLDTRSRVLLGVAVLLLAVLAALQLRGGDDPLPVVPAATGVPAGAVAPTPSPTSSAPLPLTQGRVKDPFRSLVPEGPAGDPGAPAPVDAPAPPPVLALPPLPGPPTVPLDEQEAEDGLSGAPVAQAPGLAAPVAAPAAAPVAGPAGGPPAAPAAPAPVLVLRSVEGEGAGTTATFTLDDTTHTATVGEGFAGLTLLALQQGPRPGQWTAVVQPDGEDPFDLVSGAPHRL